jgi:hypothetical protein
MDGLEARYSHLGRQKVGRGSDQGVSDSHLAAAGEAALELPVLRHSRSRLRCMSRLDAGICSEKRWRKYAKFEIITSTLFNHQHVI